MPRGRTPKTEPLELTFTAHQRAAIDRAATECGLSPAAYAREVLLEASNETTLAMRARRARMKHRSLARDL